MRVGSRLAPITYPAGTALSSALNIQYPKKDAHAVFYLEQHYPLRCALDVTSFYDLGQWAIFDDENNAGMLWQASGV
jgi:hypothetical protein